MDIHKPKPWHGLREFLKEYLIIVVGVLTALAGEQAVEWLHWRHIATDAEQDLATGLQPNLLNAGQFIADAPCQRARLSALAKALEQPGSAWRGAPLAAPLGRSDDAATPAVVDGLAPIWSHAAWEAALANGALLHMPKARVEGYADLYHFVELAREREVLMFYAYPQLTALAIDRTLTAEEKGRYLNVVAEVDQKEQLMVVLSRLLLQRAHRMGLDPAADKFALRIAGLRAGRGACVATVKIPLT